MNIECLSKKNHNVYLLNEINNFYIISSVQIFVIFKLIDKKQFNRKWWLAHDANLFITTNFAK